MKKYILIIAVFFTIGISGCKKDYLSLEVNPNSPSVTTPQLTLAGALKITADIGVFDYLEYGIWGGYWTPSGNYVPSASLQQFQFTNSSFTGVWTDLYSNLTNYNNLYNATKGNASLADFQAIAMIMKAYDFQQLVDNFNDVPYTQAFQPSTILFPAYDKGLDIYHDLGKQLDAAIALIKTAGVDAQLASADVMFYGDMDGWRRFANSLKLRLAMRVSTTLPGDALVTDLASTSSVGYLDGVATFPTLSATVTKTGASVNPGYSDVAGKENPFYGYFGFDANGNPGGGNVYYRANTYFVNLLNNANDPRINQVYAPTTAGNVIQGNVFGDTKTTLSNPNTSAVGPGYIVSPAQDEPLMLASESLFLQAEAAQKGFLPGDAKTLYQAAVTSAFLESGLTADQATTYLAQGVQNVTYTDANALQVIAYQKYIALYGYFNFEAYNEYRRTGYPNLPSSIDPAAISQTLPTRIYYPLSELTSNGANLAKEPAVNIFTSKIFWAK